MSGNIKELTNDDFEELTAKGNWAIDFWAEWCGPCKMMAPEFDKAAIELKGKVNFAKVNIDEQPDLAQMFDVMSIPTILILKSGKEVDRVMGAMPKAQIVAAVSGALK